MLSKPLFLPRADLADRMLKAIEAYSLTVVTAPMGYGKTTLAQSVAGLIKKKVYFYSVPAGPHEARYLWRDIFDQFETQGLTGASALRRIKFPESPSQSRQAIEQLRGLDSPTYLILDDYHQVTDSGLSVFWETVIKAGLPDFHIALFSRTRPNLNLEELRIKGLAAVFDQQVLAFTEAETRDYFRLYGINAPTAAAEAHRYSEGWPAALWLCLQSWRASGLIASSPDIESLLGNTVFSSYKAGERSFLMRLSVLESFTVQEAERLSGDPGTSARLRKLREKNAFLSYDFKTRRYQFHGIFRDFLGKELAAEPDIDKPALYRLAGECCLERPDLISAFRLLARAGRDDDLRRLLDLFLLPEYDQAFLFFYEEIFALTISTPWPVRMQNPLGYLAFIAMCVLKWQDVRAVPLLEEARERFRAPAGMPEFLHKRVQGEFEVISGLLAFNDIWEVMRHYAEAHRQLHGPSVILAKGIAWGFGCPDLSFMCHSRPGHYLAMAETIEENVSLYKRLSAGSGLAATKMCRGGYWLELGELERAEFLLREVLLGRGENRLLASALMTNFALARTCLARGRPEEAVDCLEKLRAQVERLENIDHVECFDLAIGYVNGCLGRIDGIPQWLRDGELYEPPHCPAPQVIGFSLVVYARALLLQGDYQRLAVVAEDLPHCAVKMKCVFAHIHSNILKAIVEWRTRCQEAGLALLREALELSRADGIVMSLAEYGRHLLPLLRQLKRAHPDDAHLDKVLVLAERMARVSEAPGSKKDLLTSREREFMSLVIEGMSNLAIAKSLGLAEVTIKKTLALAYVKLGAVNRAEASRRFVEIYGDKRRPAEGQSAEKSG